MEILQNIGLGLLGVLLYTLFKSKDYVFAKEFDLSTFLMENLKGWIWTVLVITVLAITLYVQPETKDVIKTFTGVDLTASPVGFFLFGVGINVLLKKPSQRAKAAKARAKEKSITKG